MYFLVGSSLLFAFLFSVNLATSVASALAWHLLANTASNWSARTRQNLIFLLRIAPPALAAVFIFAFVLPSFLMFEPGSTDEVVGLKLAVIALISAFGIAAAFCRIFASWWRTRRLIREWLMLSEPFMIESMSIPAFRLRHPFPVIAIVGVFRPKMFVAENVLSELDEEELAAAIAHECGHISTHDNLKRIIMRICADLLVFPLGKTLDRVWLDTAESAADEFAANKGGKRSALDLASALIKVGKITPQEKVWEMPLGAFLLEPTERPLTFRVDNLLRIADMPAGGYSITARSETAIKLILFLTAVLVLLLALNNGILSAVHSISETLFIILQ